MGRTRSEPAHKPRLVATTEAFTQPVRLLAPFLSASKVGFGICDRQLRYQAINPALAATNRIPTEAHLNHTVRDVLGDVAAEIEIAFERVLVTGKPVLKEISGNTPSRPEVVHWIANYFPVRDQTGRIQSLGAVVVEVTEQKALQESLRALAQELLLAKAKEQGRIAKQLHASMVQYFAAVKRNLSQLVRPIWQIADRAELLAQSAHLLEHFPVVPLKSGTTARVVFQQVEQNPKLRRQLFARIADMPALQREMLQLLKKHPEVQSNLIDELARTLKFRRWLLRITSQKM